jgi:signal transduction histidine kinase
METDEQLNVGLAALADHLSRRRGAILENWRQRVDDDPALTSASTLARNEFFDHIPAILEAFAQMLRARFLSQQAEAAEEQRAQAGEHGLHRWHHGYNQHDVMREWSHLHICLVNELENYLEISDQSAIDGAMSFARRSLAQLCSEGVNESAARYAELQQIEAAARIRDLEQALATLNELEQKRIETWRRAVHDVRGKFGVVKNITEQLTQEETDQKLKTEFLSLLGTSVTSLHDLLNNLLVLSRLEAGQEQRHVQSIDAAALLKEQCELFRPLATERELALRLEGVDSLPVQGDAVNIQRIAQNLILNAIKYTAQGGVTIGWEAVDMHGLSRWAFFVRDTGPGFYAGSAAPLARTIEASTVEAEAVEQPTKSEGQREVPSNTMMPPESAQQTGEGIGLAIVKRLCELLDATLELYTVPDVGSTFRVVLPREYRSAV